uniref:Secreted protein n=1 Tax=Rhipicephalus appendiculatus TaxID=34631 RepID=A0A131YHE6_RHIAP
MLLIFSLMTLAFSVCTFTQHTKSSCEGSWTLSDITLGLHSQSHVCFCAVSSSTTDCACADARRVRVIPFLRIDGRCTCLLRSVAK